VVRVQIFLSSASAEFRSCRDSLRHDRTRPNVFVAVQEDCIVTDTDTLDTLDDGLKSRSSLLTQRGVLKRQRTPAEEERCGSIMRVSRPRGTELHGGLA
jgi:hypothetical protein